MTGARAELTARRRPIDSVGHSITTGSCRHRTEADMAQPPMWRRDPEAKKVAILRAARRLFTERGYADATVRDIADRAGVNQSLIFRYFGSKEELFERSAPRREYINELFADGWEAGVLRMIQSFAVDDDEVGSFVARLMRDARSGEKTATDTLERISARIAEQMTGPEGPLLADMVVAWTLGLGVLYDVVHRPSVVQAGPKRIARFVVDAVARLDLESAATKKRRTPASSSGRPRKGRPVRRSDE